jgi:hypothetical protein
MALKAPDALRALAAVQRRLHPGRGRQGYSAGGTFSHLRCFACAVSSIILPEITQSERHSK